MCFTKRREFIFSFLQPQVERERKHSILTPGKELFSIIYRHLFFFFLLSVVVYIPVQRVPRPESYLRARFSKRDPVRYPGGLSPKKKKMHASRNLFPPQVDSLHDITRHTHTKNKKKLGKKMPPTVEFALKM